MNVRNLFQVLLDGHGEQSLFGLVVTADRGYASMTLVRSLLLHGIASIIVMPEDFLRCHPLVGQSYFSFSVTRHDDEETDSVNEDPDAEEDGSDDDNILQQNDVQDPVVGIESDAENCAEEARGCSITV